MRARVRVNVATNCSNRHLAVSGTSYTLPRDSVVPVGSPILRSVAQSVPRPIPGSLGKRVPCYNLLDLLASGWRDTESQITNVMSAARVWPAMREYVPRFSMALSRSMLDERIVFLVRLSLSEAGAKNVEDVIRVSPCVSATTVRRSENTVAFFSSENLSNSFSTSAASH
jgi:hypothetical protein